MRLSLLTVFLFVIAVAVMGHRNKQMISKLERLQQFPFLNKNTSKELTLK